MKSHFKFNAKLTLISGYAFNDVVSKRLFKEILRSMLATTVSSMSAAVDLDHANLFLIENNIRDAEMFSVKFSMNELTGDYSARVTLLPDHAIVVFERM